MMLYATAHCVYIRVGILDLVETAQDLRNQRVYLFDQLE